MQMTLEGCKISVSFGYSSKTCSKSERATEVQGVANVDLSSGFCDLQDIEVTTVT